MSGPVHVFNLATGKWEQVELLPTLDDLKGRVGVGHEFVGRTKDIPEINWEAIRKTNAIVAGHMMELQRAIGSTPQGNPRTGDCSHCHIHSM